MRFLIARLSALGDTVCSLPVAVALKQAFPDCHITWAVSPRFQAVVEGCSAVDHVFPVTQRIPTYSERFDAAIDCQGLLKSALCIARAKADRKVGYHWQREGSAFFSERILPDPTSHHIVDQYVDVARALGANMSTAEFGLKPQETDVLSVRRKLKERGLVGRFVLVNPGAGWASKRWPAQSFASLIDALPLPVVLLGAKSDLETAQGIAERCAKKPASLVGETSIGELMALVRIASAHVGGDTGSTHLAAAMDIPAIGLYSITRPERSCPYGQIHLCHYHPEGLAEIRVEDVVQTVLNAIEL